jgi:hypothetical protein
MRFSLCHDQEHDQEHRLVMEEPSGDLDPFAQTAYFKRLWSCNESEIA